ncbi:TPA: hypothetical protein ACP32N_006537 [Pseudomonas aeruginosa]
MSDYLELFRAAMQRTNELSGGMSNYPLAINPKTEIDLSVVVREVAKDFTSFIPNTNVLPGKCYRVARELSYILFDLRIRHTVTIGDVELVDGLYTGATPEQLTRDVLEGYQLDFVEGRPVGKPINGHAWITLEDGCVLDATVLASQHRKSPDRDRLLTFEEAIYVTGKRGTPVVRHIPMLTGLVYHQKALTSSVDGDFENYCKWAEDYGRLMARLDLLRLAPELAGR